MRITFISWTRFDRRSELLAQHLDATLHFIYYGQRGRLFQAPFRYLVQALQTWRVLSQERPNVVFVQNPPIFCVLVAYLYDRIYGGRYIIDSHTSAFLSPKWSRFLWLHRILSKVALATIVHNESQENVVKSWGCRYFVLADPVGGYPAGVQYFLDGQYNVAVVSTFEYDEPLGIVFEAANRLSEVDFHITGDFKLADPRTLENMPENCHLTGFLPYDQYIGLLRAVDVVVDLTTRDHTLLCGAFEAVSLGKPLIISDWPILREHFYRGTVHIPNTAEGICEGIQKVRREQATLEGSIVQLREESREKWERKFSNFQRFINHTMS